MPVGNANTFYVGIFFPKVAYKTYDVLWFIEWIDFSSTDEKDEGIRDH
jgi:hypothetical protein